MSQYHKCKKSLPLSDDKNTCEKVIRDIMYEKTYIINEKKEWRFKTFEEKLREFKSIKIEFETCQKSDEKM